MKKLDPALLSNGNRKRDWLAHLERALATGGALALVLAQLRQKKGVLGWIAVAISATQFALSFRKQYLDLKAPDVWGFFSQDEQWSIASPILSSLLAKSCDEHTVIAKDGEYSIILGQIYNEVVAWRAEGSRVEYGPFLLRGRETETLKALGIKLWSQVKGHHAVLGDKGAIESVDEDLDHEVVEFDALIQLHQRVCQFYEAGENRSYLLDGPPGTGKSTAVRYILAKTKLRSLRLTFDKATHGSNWSDSEGITRNVEALLQTLRPEMLIIDDFDRNWMDERELLRLMEIAHKCCRVVIATVNHKEGMTSAMHRVGRFDDHIRVDRIELKVLKAMLDPELHKYAHRMVKWPIAFVGDLNTRKRVLGIMATEKEFQELHRRVTGQTPRKLSGEVIKVVVPATKKAPTKKAPTKKAPTKKAPTKKAPTKKAPTKKA